MLGAAHQDTTQHTVQHTVALMEFRFLQFCCVECCLETEPNDSNDALMRICSMQYKIMNLGAFGRIIRT